MATDAKAYVVEDAGKSPSPKTACTPYPGTLAGLLDALGAARYRSAAGTMKVVVIVGGKQRTIIRGLEGGNEVWSASRAGSAMSAETGRRADTTGHGFSP